MNQEHLAPGDGWLFRIDAEHGNRFGPNHAVNLMSREATGT
jgi:hypothetical protein